MSDIKKLIESPHSIHKNNSSFWEFLLQSYEGGKDYIGSYATSDNILVNGKPLVLSQSVNLFQHKKERVDDFKKRVDMSYYYNFCAPVIDIYTNHLFKKPIIETWGSLENDILYRKDNIDRKDSSIYEFRKEIADLSQIYGHAFILVDEPSADKTIYTKQDEIDNDLFPYFTIFHPQNVINWSLDMFGRPYWVLLRETRDGNQDAFNFDPDATQQVNYRLWTRKEWVYYDNKGAELRRASHRVGSVPIVCAVNKKSKKVSNFIGISALSDIAYIARDIYNSCSELKQILRDQTFSILTLQGSSGDYDEITVGTSKAILYPPEMERPGYISPDAANAEAMFKHIDRQISAIFRLAKLEGASAKMEEQSATQQSGVSKAWDFNETNQNLSDKADNLEDAEMKLWRIFGLYRGKEFDGSVSYPDEFSIQSLMDDLDEAEQAMKLNICKSFNVEIKKSIIKKKFPRLPEKELENMLNEAEQNEGRSEGGSLLSRMGFNKPDNTLLGGKKEESNV